MPVLLSPRGEAAVAALLLRHKVHNQPIHIHHDHQVVSSSSSPSSSARSENQIEEDAVSEAQRLKEQLQQRPSTPRRFSLSQKRQVLLPPVEIPEPLAAHGLRLLPVSGAMIPLTRAMFDSERSLVQQRLPEPVHEA